MGEKTKKNPHAVALGRKGGRVKTRKGFATLTPEQRREVAARANRLRWERRGK